MPPTFTKPALVISTVGVSLLLNNTQQGTDEYQKVNRLAKLRHLTESADKTFIENLQRKAIEKLATASVTECKKMSAELNGIMSIYDDQLQNARKDQQVLIGTDTELGRICAKIIHDHLELQSIPVLGPVIPENLTFDDPANFAEGVKKLIRWCYDTIPGYRDNGYQIIFNLSAAIKSLTMFLSPIGMIYDAQVFSVFEGDHATPIYVPSLPITFDIPALHAYALQLALMADGGANVPASDVSGLAPTLYETIDGKAFISPWGILMWQQICKDIYTKELLPFDYLTYTDNFRSDFTSATDQDKVALQITLAKVATYLMEGNGDRAKLRTDGGLLYSQFKNKIDHGLPIDHFRVTNSVRVSCVVGKRGLILRHYGAHNYVENNP